MALITVDEFMALPLGLKGPNAFPPRDVLATYIDTASTMVEQFCERAFASQSHAETLRGRDTYRLILGEYPVTGLTSVTWEDEDTGSTGTIDTADLRTHEWGAVEWKRKGAYDFASTRLYTVTYTAGYSSIPGPVKHAVGLQVTELLQPNYGGAMQSVPELVPLASQLIVDLLDDYRRKVKRA